MELYEVESTRWYYSTVVYKVIAEDEDDAWERCERDAIGVLEISASSPTWNGEEECFNVEVLKTVHDMNVKDNAQNAHTNCQYIGSNLWNCGHANLENPAVEDVQLPLWRDNPPIDSHEVSGGK